MGPHWAPMWAHRAPSGAPEGFQSLTCPLPPKGPPCPPWRPLALASIPWSLYYMHVYHILVAILFVACPCLRASYFTFFLPCVAGVPCWLLVVFLCGKARTT